MLVALLVAATATFLMARGEGGASGEVRAADDRAGPSSSTSTTATSTTAPATTAAPPTTMPPAPTTTRAPVPTTSAPTTVPAPPFQSAVEPVTALELGASWRPGCPVGADALRAVSVSHWGYDGAVRTGRLVVHAEEADRMVAVFRDVYAARFPIQQMVPIDAYGGDDQASMRANNTSAFNCRYVAGTTRWSEHAFGRAVDVNPLVNPYVKGSSVDPPEGAPYADRSRNDPGMIHAGDAVVRAFADQGWGWGGAWSSGKDYQHFSASGR